MIRATSLVFIGLFLAKNLFAHEAIMLQCSSGLFKEFNNDEVALKEISLFTDIHWGENSWSQSYTKISSHQYMWLLDGNKVSLGIATTLSRAEEITSGSTIILTTIDLNTLEGTQYLSMLLGKSLLDQSFKPKEENIKAIKCNKVQRGII